MTAAAAGGALLSTSTVAKDVISKGKANREGAVELPSRPSPNPAFLAHYLNDGGAVVWTITPDSQTKAYRLNSAARIVWELADGTRTGAAIAQAYAENSQRPASEGAAFLKELVGTAIVAVGGFVVPEGDFPRPEKGVYRSRVSGVRSNRG